MTSVKTVAAVLAAILVTVGVTALLLPSIVPAGTTITYRTFQNHISLNSVSLETKSLYPTPHLSAMVIVNASVPLSSLQLYINSTYLETQNYTINATNYAIWYRATVSNQTMAMIAGKTYLITFVATFQDKATSTASASVLAS